MPPPSSSSPLPPHRSHLFTPIQEGNESQETDQERHRMGSATPSSAASTTVYHHNSTPFHEPGKNPTKPRRPTTVSCTDCRPTTREKTSMVVVPLDNHSLSSSSPTTGLFKSLIAGFSRRSPKPTPSPSTQSSSTPPPSENHWRIAIAELSHKLVQATRRRDEAILESSKLKYTMAELEKKLNKLEVYCQNLKSGLEICGYNNHALPSPARGSSLFDNKLINDVIVKNFLVSVSDARTSIRCLSKSLTSQLKLMGVKVFERLSEMLRYYDIKLLGSSHPRHVQFYLESLLNHAFFVDFESVGFERGSTTRVLNPIERSETNYKDYAALKDLDWEEVLSKGTKHFSEEFSRFCDRKMSEIVAMLGWNRAWPEQLLQAFFGASKSVWLVHLLANSVHPSLTVFRVDKGVRFDPVYMDDVGGGKGKKLLPSMVRIMVTPGFYVYDDNVVKCKVICKYYDSTYSVFSGDGGSDNSSLSPP